MHERKGFRAIVIEDLSRHKRERAINGLMFVTQKGPASLKEDFSITGSPPAVG